MIDIIHLLAVWHYTARMISERLLWRFHHQLLIQATVYILKVHQLRRYLVFDPPPRLPAPVHWSEHAALTATLASPFFNLPPLPFLTEESNVFPGASAVAGRPGYSLSTKWHTLHGTQGRVHLSPAETHYREARAATNLFSTTQGMRDSVQGGHSVLSKGEKCQAEKNTDDSNFESPSKCQFFLFFFVNRMSLSKQK